MPGYVTLDTHEIHELARDLRVGAEQTWVKAERIVAKSAYDIDATAQTNLVENGSVDTGHLLNSMGVDIDSTHARIGPTADYGDFVEEGTDGPYEIPNAFGLGITVIHPGNDPKPYLAPAFDRHLPSFELAMGALGEGILR
jgi:hypothetical protein